MKLVPEESEKQKRLTGKLKRKPVYLHVLLTIELRVHVGFLQYDLAGIYNNNKTQTSDPDMGNFTFHVKKMSHKITS
jgi:hypothetical protein